MTVTAPPLSALLRDAATVKPVRLLLDTLDLIVREHTAQEVAYVLRRLSRTTSVIWTCREQEWLDFLSNEPGLVQALYRLPALEPDQIAAWAQAYTAAAGVDPGRRDAFITSITRPEAAQLCATPLRLVMACDIYAPEGAIPNNLTVTKLYDRYWAKRIEHDRHGRRGTAAARAQAAVAEDVAAEMWRCSATRLAISVAGQQVGDRAALQRLISDGVLTQIGGRYEFFHQTYSEYAVARWLSRSGSATDLDRLRDALDNGSVAGLWPVARHLLQLEMSADRYTTLAQAVPITTAEGVRVQFLAAFNRHRPDLVTTVASRVDPQLLTSSVTVLSAAGDECVSVAAAVVITCLKLADSAGIARTAATAAAVVSAPARGRPAQVP